MPAAIERPRRKDQGRVAPHAGLGNPAGFGKALPLMESETGMDRVRSQRERAQMGSANRLKLGLFGANCSSGRAVTMVPERWSGKWRDCLALAKMADEAGIEFMLPIGRWKGYGGATDYQGETLETVTCAAGLLASTQRLVVFGTVHAPLIAPLIAAKEFVTADHIGEARFGLNLVCGWNEGEFEMFGANLRDHETRYDYAQEWLDIVKRAWASPDDPETDFDFTGRYFTLRQVRAKPKPYGGSRPLIMNAGASPTGQAFAIRNCDALFSQDRKSTRLNSSHMSISYAVFCLKKKNKNKTPAQISSICESIRSRSRATTLLLLTLLLVYVLFLSNCLTHRLLPPLLLHSPDPAI